MTTPNNDMRFLRTIPEDRSDLASSLALSPQSVGGPPNSSVMGLDAGREGSIISTAPAVLADGSSPALGRRSSSRRRRPKLWSTQSTCVAFSMLLVVVGAIVAVVLVATSDKSNTPDIVTTSSPTAAPTLDPEVVASLDAVLTTLSTMQDVLQLLNNTSSELQEPVIGVDEVDPSDPRILARNWILNEDLLRDELLASDNTQAILQRFVLVELYYATHGDVSWTPFKETRVVEENSTTVPFLTPEATECTWEGIECDENEDSFFYVRTIHLENRNLTGTLPASLYILQELGEISLLHNAITGPLPDLWFSNDTTHTPGLFKLDLEDNQLTGTIPPNLWSHGNMRFVYLDNNKLSGPVFNGRDDPMSTYLEEVWIYNNTLTGFLPSWLFAHEFLKVFWADGNQFSGSLPQPSFFPSPSLQWLTLSFNALTGPLLAGHLEGSSLESIGLNDNQLSGPLPKLGKDNQLVGFSPELGNDKSRLTNVWLHNNLFSGNIPINFGLTWSQLRNLDLTGNPDLTGNITVEQCQVWDTRENPVENVQVDCPPIVCLGACCSDKACYDT